MKTPPPLSAKVARARVARTFAIVRTARRAWLELRTDFANGATIPLQSIGFATMTLWAAEKIHDAATARYQVVLKAREDLPKEQRWSLADLNKWMQTVRVVRPSLTDAALEP